MKKYILIFVGIAISFYSNSQTVSASNLEDLQFKVGKSEVLKIGDPQSKIITLFGMPDKQEPYIFEMNETTGTLFKYGESRMFFEEGIFYAWTIKDPTILIGRANKYFRVGDPASRVFEVFPEFQQGYSSGFIKIPLRSVDYEMECTNLFIEVENGIIKRILRHDC